jgi:hypothetical protein
VGDQSRGRQSPKPWLRVLAWVLTLVALGLHLLSLTATHEALSNEHVRHDALSLVGLLVSPLITLLAIGYALSTSLGAKPLTLRRTLLWLLLGALGVAGWPVSCAVSVLNAPNAWKNYHCNEDHATCSCSTDSDATGEATCTRHYACCVEYPERIDFAPDDPHPYDPGGCDCFDLEPGETCQGLARSKYDLRGIKSLPDRCPPP